MPAISPYNVQASGAGVRMSDVGLTGDEDYLLVHSVEDSCEYQNEIIRFNQAGKRIYTCLQDPVLRFAFDADCLAFEGLANYHPGAAIDTTWMLNLLSGAFQWNTNPAHSVWMYRRPKRKRMAGNLASIQFEIEVIPINELSAASTAEEWPAPSTILTSSTTSPEDLPPADSRFGCSVFWRRKTTLDLGTYEPDYNEGADAAVTNYYQGWPSTSTHPANLAAFLVSVDAYGDTESEIVEVYDVVSGTNWLLASGETALIPTALLSATDPRDFMTDAEGVVCRYVAKWDTHGIGNTVQCFYTNYADLDAFLDENNDGAVIGVIKDLIWLYDTKIADFIPIPP